MNEDLLVSIISALGAGGFFTATYAFFKWLVRYMGGEKEVASEQPDGGSNDDSVKVPVTHFNILFDDIQKVYDSMSDALEALSADRILILHAHNGGSVPTLRVPVYSSVLYEAHVPNSPHTGSVIEPMKTTWKSQVMDADYVMLLKQMALSGTITWKTKDMPPSVLKDVYEVGGVAAATIFTIYEEDNLSLYYGSITTSDPDFEDNPAWRNGARIFRMKLRTLFEKGIGNG